MERLETAFRNCEKLQNHMRFLLDRWVFIKYTITSSFSWLYSAERRWKSKEIEVYGEKYKGRALYDALESYVRRAFFAVDPGGTGAG